jgi:transcriptional regulator with XRE-family HTH domain
MSGDEHSPGLRIARARRRRGLSQAVLAGLVGRSESWLSQVERGKRGVDSHTVLTRMAAVLRVEVEELTGPADRDGEEGQRVYEPAAEIPVHDAAGYGYLLSATYRRRVPASCVPAFGTEHLDLSWENVTARRFRIIDMEHWGVAVTGYGAAYLYLTALVVPAVAAQVHEALADVLESPSGRYAQLVAAALILRNLTRLPDPGGLAARLHRHTDTLLA